MASKTAAKPAKTAEKTGVKPNARNGADTKEEQPQEEESPTNDADKKTGDKRKRSAKSSEGSSKAPRRSGRGGPEAEPSKVQLLKFLLSPEAIDLCRSEDESKDLRENGKDRRTYSASEFSPFEELLCAMILSRPISHALGARTIRTILNDPYSFTTPEAIQKAGKEKRLQSLWDARTQHKDKTADQIELLAEVVPEKFASGDKRDTSLEGVRKEAGRDMEKERNLLRGSIKGVGKTGMSIFFRRIQWLWEECYPFVDERTEGALKQMGLPDEAEELVRLIEEHWGDLGVPQVERRDEEMQKRRAFVVVLERVTGARLEHNVEMVLHRAAGD